MNEIKWVLVCCLIFLIAFITGYVAGVNIPNHVEFGLDQKTIDLMKEINNCTNTDYNMTNCSNQNPAGRLIPNVG